MITKIYPETPNWDLLHKIAAQIRDGAIIIYPTGISYSYGCSAYTEGCTFRLPYSSSCPEGATEEMITAYLSSQSTDSDVQELF